jgi:hypothetical protein
MEFFFIRAIREIRGSFSFSAISALSSEAGGDMYFPAIARLSPNPFADSFELQ